VSYFSYLCFFWALVGLSSRFFIIKLGNKWNEWELEKIYSQNKPKWIYFLALLGILLVAFTWYKVFTTQINYSWIIALLISLTLIKIFNLLFRYEQFREFVVNTLNDKKRWLKINISIIIFSIILTLMGFFLYSGS